LKSLKNSCGENTGGENVLCFEMAVFKDRQRMLYVMQLLITQLVVWLGWLSHITLAQLEISEKVTGSGSFPDLVITCITNLSVFITCFLGRRLDLDISARDVVAPGPKLEDINGFGVSICKGEYQNASVVMLSNCTPTSSMRHFMKYLFNAHDLYSIVLQCNRLEYAVVPVQTCKCSEHGVRVRCNCIVFSTVEDITIILANRMPGILKRLSDSLCLLPSLKCLKNGCHGCNEGMLHVESQRLIQRDSMVESPAAVCETLDIFPDFFTTSTPDCICIPVHPADNDEWTKLLIRSLRKQDPEIRSMDRGIVTASDALQNYMDQKGGCLAIEKYKGITAVFPKFAELVINVILTSCLRVDGFSSALVARRAVREYLIDSKGTGFSANMFLVKALVKSNADYTHVCQVLTFRSSVTTLSFIVGIVNLFCSFTWALLVAFEGGVQQWYDIHSMPLSTHRLAVLMAAIGTALVTDCLDWFFLSKRIRARGRISDKMRHLLWAVIVLEITYIVSGVAVATTLGIKGFGKWVYAALQGLVWVKWGIGSIILDEFMEEFDTRQQRTSNTIHPYPNGRGTRYRFESGILVYSAFFLNAILAGVRANWTYSPS
jgi:hypothetical protein